MQSKTVQDKYPTCYFPRPSPSHLQHERGQRLGRLDGFRQAVGVRNLHPEEHTLVLHADRLDAVRHIKLASARARSMERSVVGRGARGWGV